MTMPIYASPEQFMRDRSEYARKGIARGRSVVVTTYSGGVLFVAENHSPTLHKVSEIYDRIGFAAVGRYNEFENLRTAGIRLADVRGFSYDRRDVTGRWLANAYAQTVGSIFSEHQKPFEVELCVAEVSGAGAGGVGTAVGADQLYRISYDGSIVDERRFVVMGGVTEPVITALTASFTRAGTCRRHCAPQWPPSGPPVKVRRGNCCRRNSRWPCWTGPSPAGPSAGSSAVRWPPCWSTPPRRSTRSTVEPEDSPTRTPASSPGGRSRRAGSRTASSSRRPTATPDAGPRLPSSDPDHITATIPSARRGISPDPGRSWWVFGQA